MRATTAIGLHEATTGFICRVGVSALLIAAVGVVRLRTLR